MIQNCKLSKFFASNNGTSKKTKGADSIRGLSKLVSKIYGVSARTIRDIWNQKTWAYATNDENIDKRPSSAVQVVFACYESGYEKT